MKSVSVIVSNFNGAKYLPRLISTLQKQEGVSLELIVVDRNSSDESDAILANHSEIKVVKHPPESGLVAGYNAGLVAASHDLLFFCNEDMWFDPNCLHECVMTLLSAERIGAVMPVQWTYDGAAIVNAGIWYTQSLWCRASPVLTRDACWHVVDSPARLSFANAGACMVRRAVFEKVGGWDSTFFLDCEDVDLGIRMWQRGWECWVVPNAILGHAVGASNQKVLPNTGTSVGRKRYVSGFSNFLMIALKYFSFLAIPRAMLAFGDVMLRDLITGRWGRLMLDFKVIELTLQRAPLWLAWRRDNRELNRKHPGEHFFFDSKFQYASILENRSPRTHVEPVE